MSVILPAISFIPGIILLFIGFMIKHKKAYYLIAGYNTIPPFIFIRFRENSVERMIIFNCGDSEKTEAFFEKLQTKIMQYKGTPD